ncbi:MAG: exonuclease SbcCD subunit D [Bacteroidales bacterium]|nr:exonuclease SbcCD subunit D [Bacteroidales bacterium]
MKIIHTADLHLGQILYHDYDRCDEHRHFFEQLNRWCQEEKPDALLVCGDVFDIQQPSNAVKKMFNDEFVALQKAMPDMHIVIIAGNHDSASRIQADSTVWTFSNTHLVGVPPAMNTEDEGWEESYIVEIPTGFIVAMPYMLGDRSQQLQSVLDRVAQRNADNKPVVMMAHLAVTGMDPQGHDFEIGTIKTQDASTLGNGYDYLALGHIHKPQTIGHPEDRMNLDAVSYPAPLIRYSGSALHVSCDETYPHTVSIVEIDHHGAEVTLRQRRIDELRHFYLLPEQQEPNAEPLAYRSEEEALMGIRSFCQNHLKGYFRLKMHYDAEQSPDFNQQVYDLIKPYDNEIRFNPKIVWVGRPSQDLTTKQEPVFEVAELQEMKDPLEFILKTKEHYPLLDMDELKGLFKEVEEEIRRTQEEERGNGK